MSDKYDIGLCGLKVMGQNLVLNMEDHGYRVAVWNRTTKTMRDFVEGDCRGKNIAGFETLPELVASLKSPRIVMLMVEAGEPVDSMIEQLLPLLSPGDVIMDGGNSFFEHTERRTTYVEGKKLLFIGTGVSGGEEGARRGPSIMPGGSEAAWPLGQADPAGHLGQSRHPGRCPLLRLGRTARCRPLREDGPQRDRIRRHAVDLRSLLDAQACRGPDQ